MGNVQGLYCTSPIPTVYLPKRTPFVDHPIRASNSTWQQPDASHLPSSYTPSPLHSSSNNSSQWTSRYGSPSSRHRIRYTVRSQDWYMALWSRWWTRCPNRKGYPIYRLVDR